MYFDSADLRLREEGGRTHGFSSSAVFAVPEVVERAERVEKRTIDTVPSKILDAPGLVDDYYLNLLAWVENRVTIALGEMVYSYDTGAGEVAEVYSTSGAYISSVAGYEHRLYIGESTGRVIAYDLAREAYDTFHNHESRVAAVAVGSNGLVSTGDKSGRIVNVDLRMGTASQFLGHSQEVCGLKWNNEYLASGSNDNSVRIWKSGSPIAIQLDGHGSAVKALDWCPWKTNVLATGGGAKDKSIKFWDTQNGNCLKTVPVSSQVCGLAYLSKYKELLTAHGFQENDLRIWKASGMRLISSFGRHDSRVLHMALSPDQCLAVSLGADESLKFWKIADKPERVLKRDSIGLR